MAASFSPTAVAVFMETRRVVVAVDGPRIVGTASLDGRAVRTMCVAPDVQGTGVGRQLMASVERVARSTGVDVLVIPASLTAEGFYAKLGFRAVRDNLDGEERTIIMERRLTAT